MIDIKLTDQELSVDDCVRFVSNASVGGISVFIGTVRNETKGKAVVRLEFEAFERMAIMEMQKIAQHAFENWSAHAVCIHHRVGTLAIGDVPVIIAVATPHRKAAFEACQYCIDTLKQTVPIWKKEIFEDGEVWVAAHP